MTRMRQTHDLWHVLTGYTADVRGEILLQAFTYAQLGSPSSLLITLLGAARAVRGWKGQLAAMRAAFDHGRRVRYLPTFRWEQHWSTRDTPFTCAGAGHRYRRSRSSQCVGSSAFGMIVSRVAFDTSANEARYSGELAISKPAAIVSPSSSSPT